MGRTPRGLFAQPLIIGLIACLLVAASCGQPHARPSPRHPHHVDAAAPGSPVAMSPATASRVHDVLESMHVHAFNPDAPPAKGSSQRGGLFVNWRGSWNGDLATAADNTNVQSSGRSDAQAGVHTERHDPLTDLVYLDDLYAYQAMNPADHAFAGDAARMEPIVKADYAQSSYYRCWVYFQLLDLDRLGPGRGWGAIALHFAGAVYRSSYDAQAGTFADRRSAAYRTDFAAQCGAMLIDAGHRQNNAAWTRAGASTMSHLIQRAQNPTTHLFPLEMRLGSQTDTVVHGELKMGEEAQLLDSFLVAYDVAGDPTYLHTAVQATSSLYDPHIGTWDAAGGGFFFGVDADGSSVMRTSKEVRQAWMVPLLAHLARLVGGPWGGREQAMLGIVRDGMWQPAISGYPYRETAQFGLYRSSAGPGRSHVVEDWVTTEAMGLACQALQHSA